MTTDHSNFLIGSLLKSHVEFDDFELSNFTAVLHFVALIELAYLFQVAIRSACVHGLSPVHTGLYIMDARPRKPNLSNLVDFPDLLNRFAQKTLINWRGQQMDI